MALQFDTLEDVPEGMLNVHVCTRVLYTTKFLDLLPPSRDSSEKERGMRYVK